MFKIDRHIEILLLNHDCVVVPGFGGFMRHHVSARYDDADGTILPPMTTVGFNPQLTLNDSLLVQSFVDTYDMSYPEALREVENEVEELRNLITDNGSFEIHSVGMLTLNSEGNYEFEPSQAGILVPRYYGLAGIDTNDFEVFLPRDLRVNMAKEASNNHADGESNGSNKVLSIVSRVAVACVAIMILAAIPFLNHNEATRSMLSEISFSALSTLTPKSETKTAKATFDNIEKPKVVIHKTVVVKKDAPKVETEKAAEATTVTEKEEVAAKTVAKEAQPEVQKPAFTVVLAARISQANAEAYAKSLKGKGIKDVRVIGEGKGRKVVAGTFKTEEEAQNSKRQLAEQEEFAFAWVLEIK